MRGSIHRVALSAALTLGVTTGCSGAVGSSKTEDGARRSIPVPICLKALPRHATAGVISEMSPADYWATIFPGFDADAKTLDTASPDCAGVAILSDPSLAGVESSGGVLPVVPESAVIVKGPDGFEVVWLPSHRFGDGTEEGALSLLRPREADAEVYAIGLYRGGPETSRFEYERIGADILVSASNDACAKVESGRGCESVTFLYLARDGALTPSARFDQTRVEYGTAPSTPGSVEYRLTSTPKFKEKSVQLTEQIVLKDSGQNELRKANLERTFTLARDGSLVPNVDSLWNQIYVGTRSAPPAPPSKPRK